LHVVNFYPCIRTCRSEFAAKLEIVLGYSIIRGVTDYNF